MSCNTCLLSDDVGGIDCAPFAAGGNSSIYIANRCQVTPTYGVTYPKGAVTALAFSQYTRLYELQGLLDTATYENPLVRENNLYRYDMSLSIQLNAESAALYNNIKDALGANLLAIAKGNNDRYYIFGLGSRGLIIDSYTDNSGAAPTDAREFTLTLTGSDTRGTMIFTTDETDMDAGFLGAESLIESYLALPTQ